MELHIPVLLNEVLEAFTEPVHHIFDGTFGRGGHTQALLTKFPQAQLVAFDRDTEAVSYGIQRFQDWVESGRLTLKHADYSFFAEFQEELPFSQFDAILLDLGVSSPQFDQAERGFSFLKDGPLDMRMDTSQNLTAATIVNEWSEKHLNDLFKEYGEVSSPYKVTRAILDDRKKEPFRRTHQLAELIARVDGWRKKGIHPATQYFMALRLEVNKELERLETSVKNLFMTLNENGRMAIITFHSLEDRIVKNVFRDLSDQGIWINKKVIVPSEEEVKRNPRARSAKLRIIQRSEEAGIKKEKKNKYAQFSRQRS